MKILHPSALCTGLLALLPSLQAAAPARAEAVEVSFPGSGELELTGTLLRPADAPEEGAPALLLLPGSGPTDRDGNQLPYLRTDMLKEVAEHLAQLGIASLRFDKRASRRYHLRLAAMGLEAQKDFFGWERFVGDARAGLAFLRAAEGIDPERVGILGHSEGGLIGLQVAAEPGAAGAPPHALVLVATSGLPMADLLRAQIERAVAAAPEEQRKAFLAELERGMRVVVEVGTTPTDLPKGLVALFPANAIPLLQVELALDPRELISAYAGPVLILSGEKDTQVPPDPHVDELRRALEAREQGSVRAVVVPSASHNLKRVETEADLGFAGPVVPAALEELATWARSSL